MWLLSWFSRPGTAAGPAARKRRGTRLGLEVLTLYAFSVENWKRPKAEVRTLMALLKRYLRSELETLLTNDIRLEVIGRTQELAPDVQHELHVAMERTRRNTGTVLTIALNYGGRAEIVDAVRTALADGLRPEDLDEARQSHDPQ